MSSLVQKVSIALVAASVTILASALPAGAVSAPPPATDPTAELLECTRGKRAADRNALFRGQMDQIATGQGMRMRFELRERVGHDDWRAVKAPGLDVWRYARPGVTRFAYRQRIAALQPGTDYRVAIKFQWRDAAGMLVERQTVRSPVCHQGGPLPNVRVGTLEQLPGPTADTRRYVVWVVNKGSVVAPRVQVSLLVDGAQVDTRGMGKVAAHGTRQIAFVGPACSSLITFELDPDDKLRELDENDNVRSFACAG